MYSADYVHNTNNVRGRGGAWMWEGDEDLSEVFIQATHSFKHKCFTEAMGLGEVFTVTYLPRAFMLTLCVASPTSHLYVIYLSVIM